MTSCPFPRAACYTSSISPVILCSVSTICGYKLCTTPLYSSRLSGSPTASAVSVKTYSSGSLCDAKSSSCNVPVYCRAQDMRGGQCLQNRAGRVTKRQKAAGTRQFK